MEAMSLRGFYEVSLLLSLYFTYILVLVEACDHESEQKKIVFVKINILSSGFKSTTMQHWLPTYYVPRPTILLE